MTGLDCSKTSKHIKAKRLKDWGLVQGIKETKETWQGNASHALNWISDFKKGEKKTTVSSLLKHLMKLEYELIIR